MISSKIDTQEILMLKTATTIRVSGSVTSMEGLR